MSVVRGGLTSARGGRGGPAPSLCRRAASAVSGSRGRSVCQWSEAVSPLHGVVGVGRHPHCVGEQPVSSPAAEVGLYVSGQRRSHLCTGWSGWAGTLTV